MSKLYKKYLELKQDNPNQLYLFKAGIFYIFLDQDAKLASSELNLKLTQLNDTVVKCGFPVSALSKYTDMLDMFIYTIVDETLNTVHSVDDYLSNTKVTSCITKIKNIDINNTSPIQALNILSDFKKTLGDTHEKE